MNDEKKPTDLRTKLPPGNMFRTYGPDAGIPRLKPGASGELSFKAAADYERERAQERALRTVQ